jgi:hypothetical protein
MRIVKSLALILALALGLVAFSPDVPSLTQFLRDVIRLDAAQLAAAERGEPVVQVLETQDVRDVAVFGIVAIDASRESYVRHLRDFQQSLRTPARARLGIFSAPPTLADVQPISFEKEDVDDLRKCQPGKCNFKLPAAEMQLMRERVNRAADPVAELTTYARQRLVDYVTDYRARGDSAMVVYDDRGNVRASDAFAALLAQSPYVYQYVPSLAEYLAAYPRKKLEGVTDVIFWSETVAPRMRRTLTGQSPRDVHAARGYGDDADRVEADLRESLLRGGVRPDERDRPQRRRPGELPARASPLPLRQLAERWNSQHPREGYRQPSRPDACRSPTRENDCEAAKSGLRPRGAATPAQHAA